MRIKSLQLRARIVVEGFSRASIAARTMASRSSSASTASTARATTHATSTGSSSRAATATTSSDSRMRRTCAATSCSTPAGRWATARSTTPRANTPHRGRHARLLPVRSARRRRTAHVRGPDHRLPAPAAPPGHLRRLLAMLDREPGAGRPTSRGRWRRSPSPSAKRGLIVLISDLLAPTDALRTWLGYLRSRGHEVIVLRVLDPAEVEFRSHAGHVSGRGIGPRHLHRPGRRAAPISRRFAAHAAEIERPAPTWGSTSE